MLSEIASRYHRALSAALKNKPKGTLEHDIKKLDAAIGDPKFQQFIKDPFQTIHTKMEIIKKMELNGCLQTCLEEMLRNNRGRLIKEVVDRLIYENNGQRSPITIWSSTVCHLLTYQQEFGQI